MTRVKTLLIALSVTIIFGGTSTWAQSWGKSVNSAPAFVWGDQSIQVPLDGLAAKVVSYTGNLNLQSPTSFPGPCPDFFANQCIVACECYEFLGSGSGSVFGKVSSGNVFLELTEDFGDFAGDPDGGCVPAYGALGITGSKDSEVLDLSGTVCQSFGSATTFIGGFDFYTASSTTCDGAGTANISSKLKLTLKGKSRKFVAGAC